MVVNDHTRFIIGPMKRDDEGRMGERESVIHMHQLGAGLSGSSRITFNTEHIWYCTCNVVPLVLNFVHLVTRIASEIGSEL